MQPIYGKARQARRVRFLFLKAINNLQNNDTRGRDSSGKNKFHPCWKQWFHGYRSPPFIAQGQPIMAVLKKYVPSTAASHERRWELT
jgi:hypothetical protein